MFRIIRLLRLLKLLRILRASRMLARWEASLAISQNVRAGVLALVALFLGSAQPRDPAERTTLRAQIEGFKDV